MRLISATAHKLARLVYFMRTKGPACVETGQQYHEEHDRDREWVVHNLTKRFQTLLRHHLPMHDNDWSVSAVALPSESRVSRVYETTNLADAYAIRLPKDASTDPELLARFLFSQQAPWVATLMRLRDALVAGFGLKTSKQLQRSDGASGDKRIHIFKIYETSTHEILLGEDDKHLDFRLSVLHQTRTVSAESTPYLVVSTVVHCHNRLGRAYIMLIAPFHRMVVKSGLRRAARVGWPTSAIA